MVALKAQLWVSRGLNVITIAVLLFTAYAGFSREDKQIDKEEMDSKATKVELTEVKTDLSKKIEDGDNVVRGESEIWQGQHDTRHDDLMIAVGEIQSNVREIKNRK